MAELSNNCKELIKRGDELFSKKEPYDALCQTLADNFYPERADFTTERALGEEFASHLSDGSPVVMRRDLGNAFSAMLRPRSQQWFAFDTINPALRKEPGVAVWLERATAILRNLMYDGRTFIRATKQADHDFATFGGAVLTVEENDRRDGLLHRNHHLKHCAWLENADGEIDTMFRNIYLTARQLAQRAKQSGWKLHEQVTSALSDKRYEQQFKCRHIMLPAEDYEYESARRTPREAKFVSIYVDCTNTFMLSEAPSYEFRYVVPRWHTIEGSQYPVSPAAMVALPDARMMQALASIIQQAGEMAISPPMKATEEAVRGEVNLYAGGITWVDRDYDEKLGPALEPIGLGKNPGLGVDLMMRLGSQLRDEWYISKLQLPQRGERTAYETSQLVEEYIRSAAPLFEPAESEYNLPLLEMEASIAFRLGLFGSPNEMPAALREAGRYSFSFTNPLQDAIKKSRVYQFQTMMQLEAIAAPVDPSTRMDLKVRDALRDAIDGSGAPAEWLEERKKADQAAQQQQQQAQLAKAVQQIGMAGQVGQDVGKAGQEIQAATQPQQAAA